MKQQDKKLLLKDICSRLPYGVKGEKYTVRMDGEIVPIAKIETVTANDIIAQEECPGYTIKPYLFPIESMSEAQKKEYNYWKHEIPVCHYEYGEPVEEIELYDSPESFDYLIENNFDCHGLIPNGLANDATGLNIY